MVDVDTFLTTLLYVMVDHFCTPARKKSGFPGPMRRSAPARQSPSPSSPDGAASALSGTLTATQISPWPRP